MKVLNDIFEDDRYLLVLGSSVVALLSQNIVVCILVLVIIVLLYSNDEPKDENSIASIRSSMLFFGVDTSDLSDEDLTARIVEMGKVVASAGVSIEEFSDSLSEVGRRVGEIDIDVPPTTSES